MQNKAEDFITTTQRPRKKVVGSTFSLSGCRHQEEVLVLTAG
jgi:hypothetical protein